MSTQAHAPSLARGLPSGGHAAIAIPADPREPAMPGQFVQIVAQNCPSCGARIKLGNGAASKLECDYCASEFRIIRPVTVPQSIDRAIAAGEKDRYANLVTILEKSMAAGNYKEGYDYCNKALEITPTEGRLWENKAICSFWLSTKQEIVDAQAKETLTYLTAARDYDPDSPTLPQTAESIAWNLFAISKIWLYATYATPPDGSKTANFLPLCRQCLAYIDLWTICYDMCPDTLFLKEAVKELVGRGKFNWPDIEEQIPTAKKREMVVKRIQEQEPDYLPPTPPASSDAMVFYAFGAIVVVGLLLFWMFK